MRRTIFTALILGLLAGALSLPAEAKKRPLARYSTTGTLVTANPGDLDGVGIARQEFLATCAIPASQGLDGYVIELPAKMQKVSANAQLVGGDATGIYDLDMYFFTESCGDNGAASTAGTNETGVVPRGTKYVLVSAFFGHDIEFTFSAVQIRG